jgi:hypothetical protein
MIMTKNENLMKLITTYDGRDIDLCYYVFEHLKSMSKEDSVQGLKLFFEEIKKVKSNRTFKLENKVPEDVLNQYHKIYANYVNELLNTLVKKAHLNMWPVDEFYCALWDILNNDRIFNEDNVYAFVILCLAKSSLLPYIELGKPVEMDNDKFSQLVQMQMETIQKVKHILGLGLAQKTEVASLILKELLQVQDQEMQIVLLAVIFDEVVREKLNGLQNFMPEVKIEEER